MPWATRLYEIDLVESRDEFCIVERNVRWKILSPFQRVPFGLKLAQMGLTSESVARTSRRLFASWVVHWKECSLSFSMMGFWYDLSAWWRYISLSKLRGFTRLLIGVPSTQLYPLWLVMWRLIASTHPWAHEMDKEQHVWWPQWRISQ
jgi:hypothetical protein